MSFWHSVSGTSTHETFEMLAYFIGARIYFYAAKDSARPAGIDRLLLLGFAIFGAFVGSKLLHVSEHLPTLLARNEWALWVGGKSILGGLLGSLVGSEVGKRVISWREPTGDPWVPALAVGMMIGRIGCQLSGVWDQTYGTPTALPWAWDYGDGIGRHPTALYEILLLAAALGLSRFPVFRNKPGASCAMFLLAYCAIRFGLEFLKPPFGTPAVGSLPAALYSGLTAIQWAALAGMLGLALMLRHRLNPSPKRTNG